jgi:cysteinyl-tRNA synthetase
MLGRHNGLSHYRNRQRRIALAFLGVKKTNHFMPLRLFNSLTQQKETFNPPDPTAVGVYVCGPTVYSYVHLGNARTFTVFDVVVRYLRYRGFGVKYVRNFTDIDDRIIQTSLETGSSASEVSSKYIQAFQEDARGLKLLEPDVAPLVTQHIPDILSLIEKLIERGVAYESQGDVYFSVSHFPAYAELSRKPLDELRAGDRVTLGEQKRDPLDFALWKAAKPGEPSWSSPWGPGRPGWHIECSAMAERHLGGHLDLHGGGIDLLFPHHENEKAQSEAATGRTFCHYWMHCSFLNLEEAKMSKSLGNVVTLRHALERLDGEALRLFLLSTHYRHPLSFQDKSLTDADARLEYFYETLRKVDAKIGKAPVTDSQTTETHLTQFEAAMDDDFNVPGAWSAISALFNVLNEWTEKPPTKDKAQVLATLTSLRHSVKRIAGVLGLFEEPPEEWLLRRRTRAVKARGLDAAQIESLLAERVAARARKDFAEADRLRATLLAMGVEVMDSAAGVNWRVAPERTSE